MMIQTSMVTSETNSPLANAKIKIMEAICQSHFPL